MERPEELAAAAAKELAKPAYEDLLRPVVREVGETLARTVHAVLIPIRGLVWGVEQIEEFVYTEVSRKLKGTPPDRLKTPEPSVAGPALEALRFAGKDPSLRDLYANLLVTAMDQTTAEAAHPAFVEIIKQLSPDEAKILKWIAIGGKRDRPVISIYAGFKDRPGTRSDVGRHVSLIGVDAGCQHQHLTPQYLGNLCRLGLTAIPDDTSYTDKTGYERLEEYPQVLELKRSIEADGRIPLIVQEVLDVTAFGSQFLYACVKERQG